MFKKIFFLFFFISNNLYAQDLNCNFYWELFYKNLSLGFSTDKLNKNNFQTSISSDFKAADFISLFFSNPNVFRKTEFRENKLILRIEDNKKKSSIWKEKNANYYLNDDLKFSLDLYDKQIIDNNSFIYLKTINFFNKEEEKDVYVLNINNHYSAKVNILEDKVVFTSKNNSGFVDYKNIDNLKVPVYWSFTNDKRTVFAKLIKHNCS